MTPLVSVIVNNFNYERYLASAIDSALAQDHRETEVIVVDDGSTDGSREVIGRYRGAVEAIQKQNGGQASAMNAGFEASSGEIVMFLDADDLLYPTAVSSVVSRWKDELAKVQFRLSIVDETGSRLGASPARAVELPSGDVVPMLAAAGGYPTPVTSGNAYNRTALQQLMAIPEDDFRISADGYLNALVPFYGPVASLQEELGAYRKHASNLWALKGRVEPWELRARIQHDLLKEKLLIETARKRGVAFPASVALRDWSHAMYRLCHLRLDPVAHPISEDTRGRLAVAGLGAIRRSPELAGAERLGYATVFLVIAAAPGPLARRVAGWALASKPRPAWLRVARGMLRRVNARRKSSPEGPSPAGEATR